MDVGFSSAIGITRKADRPSIAVLPFSGGGDPDGRYFSDGVTEDIIVELSRFRDILVIAPSSSFAFESHAHDAGRVARELDVRYVLEGNIRRAAGRLRITAQLIDAHGGDRVWTDRHDETDGDVLEIQAQMATRIVGSLVPELQRAELRRAERLPLDDPHAYELALKASARIVQGMLATDIAAITDGIALAEEALERDPFCLRAHYAVALGFCRRAAMGFFRLDTHGDLQRADAAAQRLRDLDDGNHAAYAIMGHIAMRKLQHDAALANLRRAHSLNPNDVSTLRWLSWVESNFGLADDAREHAELSLRLSPRDRAIDQSYWALALSHYVGGDPGRCVTVVKQAIALNPRFTGHTVLLVAALAEQGALDEARQAAEVLMAQSPGLLRSRLAGRTYFAVPALAARYRRALSLAVDTLEPEPAQPDPPSPVAAPVGFPIAASAATPTAAPPLPRHAPLTDREREVLRCVAEGGSNAEVAHSLGISEHTAKRHVANILTKLGLPTRAAAVAAAAREGLL